MHPTADVDTQLMLLAAAGARDAAAALVDRNRGRIAGYITRLVRDRRVVEDLTQDVFLLALKNADQFRPTAKVSTWLYRIATNTTLNYLKQRAVRGRTPTLPEGPGEPPDRREPGPEQQVSQDELRYQVSAAVHTLPLSQRIALTLFEYEDCSYEQIAAVLDTTVESVRCLLRRARLALRAELEGLK
jgi:RNA polymerase sigma-70 factor (ECF subfamily)